MSGETELYFAYGAAETEWLKKRDKKLGAVIDLIGPIKRIINPDPFPSLMNAIIGQQISGKAQETIWNRFTTAFSPLTPERIAAQTPENLRPCGVSLRKASYMRDIAAELAYGELRGVRLENLEDDELREKLVKLRGIGSWTVEMLLIFTFQRQNILSFGDFGIRRGLRMLYGHKEITRELFSRYYRRYSPYASVASLYLWEVAGGAATPLALSDPAIKKLRDTVNISSSSK